MKRCVCGSTNESQPDNTACKFCVPEKTTRKTVQLNDYQIIALQKALEHTPHNISNVDIEHLKALLNGSLRVTITLRMAHEHLATP